MPHYIPTVCKTLLLKSFFLSAFHFSCIDSRFYLQHSTARTTAFGSRILSSLFEQFGRKLGLRHRVESSERQRTNVRCCHPAAQDRSGQLLAKQLAPAQQGHCQKCQRRLRRNLLRVVQGCSEKRKNWRQIWIAFSPNVASRCDEIVRLVFRTNRSIECRFFKRRKTEKPLEPRTVWRHALSESQKFAQKNLRFVEWGSFQGKSEQIWWNQSNFEVTLASCQTLAGKSYENKWHKIHSNNNLTSPVNVFNCST